MAGAKFFSEGFGHTNYPRLAGYIIYLPGVAHFPHYGRNVYNIARAFFEHHFQRGFAHIKSARQVYVNYSVPVVLAHTHEQIIFGNARVINQYVHTAQLFYGFGH